MKNDYNKRKDLNEEVFSLKRKLNGYIRDDSDIFKPVDLYMTEKKDKENEYKKINKESCKKSAIRNLKLTAYYSFFVVPVIIGIATGASIGVNIYNSISDSQLQYIHMDNTGYYEEVVSDFVDSFVIKTPYELENGKYISKTYEFYEELNDLNEVREIVNDDDYLKLLGQYNAKYIGSDTKDSIDETNNEALISFFGDIEDKSIEENFDGSAFGLSTCIGLLSGAVLGLTSMFLLWNTFPPLERFVSKLEKEKYLNDVKMLKKKKKELKKELKDIKKK